MLPPALRRPVGLAYLLARTSDTIADSAGASAEVRLTALHQFGEAIHGNGPLPDLPSLEAGINNPAEKILLTHTAALLKLLQATEADDRALIVWVLDEILHGQILDVQRFAPAGDGKLQALANAGELDDYTYSVAGCVGEFWTRICNRHLAQYSRLEADAMVRLGIAFGNGLQLINILRDLLADLTNGRCYLPFDELTSCGHDPDRLAFLKTNPVLARPVFNRWSVCARAHLDSGLQYIEAVRPWRLRLACFLPWALGMKTLALMEQTPPLETPRRIKVPRQEVRRLLVWGVFVAVSNDALRWYARRLARKS